MIECHFTDELFLGFFKGDLDWDFLLKFDGSFLLMGPGFLKLFIREETDWIDIVDGLWPPRLRKIE